MSIEGWVKLTVLFKGKKQQPRKITTDKLASYKAATNDMTLYC